MVLEATVLVLDNSEWMRNGDYTPSRIEAQNDAATLLFNAKTQSNPENKVALMTMGGKSPSVLVTLTSDFGKVIQALHQVHIAGSSNISTGVQIAQLVLKHRENKNQRQRIIVFVASPIAEDEATLVKLGKKLKKNNVAIDIVNFGETLVNSSKLEAFIESVNSNDNSHLVTIPPGPTLLSDVLISSPIISGEDGGAGVGAGYEFGVDPTLDPELALALRISMEEEKARQDKSKDANPSSSKKPATIEDEMLAQALAMSMESGSKVNDDDVVMVDHEEDEETKRAIAMSMSGGAEDLNKIVGNLPGVDPNDPRLKKALQEDKKSKETPKK